MAKELENAFSGEKQKDFHIHKYSHSNKKNEMKEMGLTGLNEAKTKAQNRKVKESNFENIQLEILKSIQNK